MIFSTSVEYRISPAFSVAPAYAYLHYFTNKGPDYYRWKQSDVAAQSLSTDYDIELRDRSHSFRIMFYFHPLALFSDKPHKSDLALGTGFGYWTGQRIAYNLAPDPDRPNFEDLDFSQGWNFVPSLYYRYHAGKIFYGMQLGWDYNSLYTDGIVPYVMIGVGFDIL